MSNFYETGWRANDVGGEAKWADSWTPGQYAQQLKGTGAHDAEYLNRYNQLTKSDSSVDNDGEWRTLTHLENNEAGTKAEMRRMAEEWKSKGFDVRVQDLDGRHNASSADIAVRKGKGQAAPVQAIEKEPIQDSAHLAEAKDRVQEWEKKSWSGDRAQETFSPANEQAMNFDATNTPNRKSYDVRDEYTGPNTPESNAVLNAYKKDFAENFSPAESNLSNAFSQTALNQQEADVPDTPSQTLPQEDDELLRNASGQKLFNA